MVMTLPPSNERPEKFILIKTDYGTHILAGWSGSYMSGANWRMSTPIRSVTLGEGVGRYQVKTNSGSQYDLFLDRYGTTSQTANIFDSFHEETVANDGCFDAVELEDACSTLLTFAN
jgi:hypothetical protein